MTSLNVIKLNASQELALVRARDKTLGHGAPLVFDKERGLVKQAVKAGAPIFLQPLLCVLPEDFTKKEFLAIARFEIFCAECLQDLNADGAEKGALYLFPALIESGGRQIRSAIPCAFDFALAQNFDLQKIFAAAQSAVRDQDFSKGQEGGDKKNQGQELVLAPTSFYFARAEISKNTWSLYDAIWKKIR